MKFFSYALLSIGAIAACDQKPPRPEAVTDSASTTPSAISPAATLDAAKATAEPERSGAITIIQTKRNGSSLAAYFMETSSPGIDCTTGATEGACKLRVCTRSMTQSATTRKTAGDILVTVGQFPSTIAPTKDGTTFWYAPRPLAPVKDGDLVKFDVAGGEAIPAFKAAVTAPSWVTLNKPVLPKAPASLAINQSADLDFVWSPATKALFNVTLVRAEREKQTSVECAFDATASKATIAKSLLAALPQGHAVFTIDVVAKTKLKSGDFDITLAVSDSLLSGGAEIVP